MIAERLLRHIIWEADGYTIDWMMPEDHRLDGVLSAEHLLDAVARLMDTNLFYLVAITGLDHGSEQHSIELLYHFCADATVVTLRIMLDRAQPQIESICSIVPSASPFERETAEMLGITFLNTPDDSPLFLPDDWEAGVYPLRKDAPIGGQDNGNSG